jgi:hypothetical protein
MSERFTDDRTRALIESLDARLRESEEVRNRAQDHWRQTPIYPDRRSVGRVRESGESEERGQDHV